MLKDMKLGKKLGLGFGTLIAIACALGALAVINMKVVQAGGQRLAEEHVPEVTVANAVERAAMETMYAMRGFALSEDARYWEQAAAHLAEVQKRLAEAKALADKHPGLAQLKDNAAKAQAKVNQYAALASETKAQVEAMAGARTAMTTAGAAFMKNCEEYLDDQRQEFADQIAAKAAPAALADRLNKLNGMGAVLGEGVEVRMAVLRAMALRDMRIMDEALARFPRIASGLDRLKAASKQESNLRQIAASAAAAKDYQRGLETYRAAWAKLQELNAARSAAADAVTEAAKATAQAGAQEAQTIATQAARDLGTASWVVIVGLAVAMALGAAVAVGLTRAITRPMALGVDFATKVAGGDLDQNLAVQQEDEVGVLAKAMTRMVENLKAKIAEAEAQERKAGVAAEEAGKAMRRAQEQEREVNALLAKMNVLADKAQSISERMSSAADQLAAQTEQITQGAQVQKDRISETVSAMEEMNATVMEVAKNAGEASGNAGQALGQAERGAGVVNQAVSGIGEVHRITRDLQDNMGELGHKAESISAVMNVISDIADQTNLLALNAAIEAARAGDAGRGFAVVADEVRKLAEKTMGATAEVGASIGAIQEAARQSIERMGAAAQAVERVTDLAQQSGAALAEIVGLVNVNARQVEGIATAAEEQSAASEEINHAMEDVHRIVGETAEGMIQSSKAVQDLAAMSAELKQLIAELKGGRQAGDSGR